MNRSGLKPRSGEMFIARLGINEFNSSRGAKCLTLSPINGLPWREPFHKHFTPPGLASANTSNELVSVMESNEANSNQSMNDDDFWLNASEPSLKAIWDNPEGDIYAELLDADDCKRRKR